MSWYWGLDMYYSIISPSSERLYSFSRILLICHISSTAWRVLLLSCTAAAAAKSLQSCPTLCDPIHGSPPGSPVPGILQARTLEWVAIPFSNDESEKWKWRCSVVSDSYRPHGLHPTSLLRPWDFPGKSTGVGCHRFLHELKLLDFNSFLGWPRHVSTYKFWTW